MRATTDVLRTRLCELLGIRYPIMQAGMGLIARGELAAAVSEAGGLGVIGAGHLSHDELRREIRLVKARTDRPFGVDILFAQVAGATDATTVRYTGEIQGQVEIVLEERVPVLVAGLGNPLGVIDEAHALGMTVMSVVGNVKQARRVVASGVDAVIAQGHEAGGHTGRIGSVVLVPAVVDAVDVPVVAAGGFGDGRGLVAALALGAAGVWMGTRFIASTEATAHAAYKQKVAAVDEEGTVVSPAHSGKPCRLLRNAFTEEWESRREEVRPYPIQFLEVGRPASVRARLEGDVEHGSAPAGQVAGLIRQIKGAGEIIDDVVAEAREVLGRLGPRG
jgi:enoyl-[acyl-carrier protein] reductase II